MMRAAGFGMKSLLATTFAVIALSIAGCAGGAEATKGQGDPPLNDNASGPEGAAGTELQRGKTYLENEKYAEAKEHLQKALEADPSSAQIMFFLAVANEGLGDAAAAEASYKKALAADPKFAEAAQNLAALYLRDPARPDDAIKLINDMLAKVPGDIGLLQNLAYAYTLKKDVDGASKQYDAILAKKGGDTPQIRLAYAQLLLDAKLRDRAAEQLKKVLAATDDTAVKQLETVARLLAAAGAFGDCVSAFTRAIAAKTDEPGLFMRRGRCRQELKDEAGARADFEAALKVDPKLVAAHYHIGLSWLADKNIANAKASLAKAAELGKGTEVGEAARKKLDELPKK